MALVDPADVARRATEELAIVAARVAELSSVRIGALRELQRRGLSYEQIAARVGLSKGRVGQILGEKDTDVDARSVGDSRP